MIRNLLLCCCSSMILVCLVNSAPTRPPPSAAVQRQNKLATIQRLEDEIDKAAASGKLRDAVRLEQRMENEILTSAIEEIFQSPDKRDYKLLKEMLSRDNRAVKTIADRLSHGSAPELEAVQDQMRRDKRAVELLSGILSSSSGGGSSGGTGNSDDGGSSGLGIITSLLGASSGKTNRLTRSIHNEDNEVDSTIMVSQISPDKVSELINATKILHGLIGGTNITNTNQYSLLESNRTRREEFKKENMTKQSNETEGRNGRAGFSYNNVLGLFPPAQISSPVLSFNDFPIAQDGQLPPDVIDITNEINGGDIADFFDKPKKPQKLENGLVGGTMINNGLSGTGLVGGTTISNTASGPMVVSNLRPGGSGLIGGVGITNMPMVPGNGLIGGVLIQNDVRPLNPGVLSPGSTGLVGGVNIPNTGLIGGTVILNTNMLGMNPSSLRPGSTGLIGGITPGMMGIVGGVPIENSNIPPQSGSLPAGGTGLIGGVNIGMDGSGYDYVPPNPSTAVMPPPPNGNGIYSGIPGGPKDDVPGAVSGVVRPAKQANGGYPPAGAPAGPSWEDGASSGGGGGGSDILGLIGPLSSSLSGGGDGDGGGSNILGALTGLIGPLSSSSSGGGDSDGGKGSDVLSLLGPLLGKLSGGDGGSDIFGAVAGLLGPLSSSLSGGSGMGAPQPTASNGGYVYRSIYKRSKGSRYYLSPYKSSISRGGSDGQGGSGGGLISGLLGSSSGGGGTGNSDGGSGSNVGSLLSGVIGASSGGGGTLDLTGGTGGNDDDDDDGDDPPAGTGSNPLSLITSVLGASSGGGGGDGDSDGGGGSNVLSLVTSVLGASSSGSSVTNSDGEGNSDGGSGGSGSIITGLLGSSSGGDGQGSDGGGSLIGSVLGSSSGGGAGGGGTGDFKGQLLSAIFRIKFAIFRSLLSLITGFLGSASGSG